MNKLIITLSHTKLTLIQKHLGYCDSQLEICYPFEVSSAPFQSMSKDYWSTHPLLECEAIYNLLK